MSYRGRSPSPPYRGGGYRGGGYHDRGYDRGYNDRGYNDRGYNDRGYNDRNYHNRGYGDRGGYGRRSYGGGGGGYKRFNDQNAAWRQYTKCIFVGNLPFHFSVNDIRDVFEKCGPIETIVIITTKNNQSKGSAFITYTTREAAEDAMDRFNNYSLEGRELRVDWDEGKEAKDRKRKKYINNYRSRRPYRSRSPRRRYSPPRNYRRGRSRSPSPGYKKNYSKSPRPYSRSPRRSPRDYSRSPKRSNSPKSPKRSLSSSRSPRRNDDDLNNNNNNNNASPVTYRDSRSQSPDVGRKRSRSTSRSLSPSKRQKTD